MTFDECTMWLKTMLAVQLNDDDSNFTRILPAMYLYADGRIYRELTFLATKITQPVRLIAGNREFPLPGTVRALQAVNVLTPAGPITDTSTRKPLDRITPEALDFFWPQASFKPGVPSKYAMVGSIALLPQQLQQQSTQNPALDIPHTVRLMPRPDKAYYAELLGDIRPAPLSPETPETYLSVYYPELLLCACMVFGSGYQRDFGAQADDPARAVSWEAQYNYLRAGIMLEGGRMKGMGPPGPPAMPAAAAVPG